ATTGSDAVRLDNDLAAAQKALAEPGIEMTEPPAGEKEEAPADVLEQAYARELESWREAERDGTPQLSVVEAADSAEPEAAGEDGSDPVPQEPTDTGAPASRLSRLVDQLASDEALFTPLT